MENLKEIIKKILESAGLADFSIDFDENGKRISVFIHDFDVKSFLPRLIFDFEHILRLVAKKNNLFKEGEGLFILDINNYRRERERLIGELAKAAARKVILNKEQIELPTMNAYERRIVHTELASRPDIKTESIGEGSERRVIVKPI